ncbi:MULTISPECIES: hypothetical protein [unclassified Microbacterium]|uniref:hypothetical protein n=1 Tax=unclassified Microbacterium TaxID=2609290 RepID=UPI00386F6D46
MSAPTAPNPTKIFRIAIWVAIGALIAAAVVCVIWVLIGDSDGIIGRAFLTILLLAGFAGISILESVLAPRRPDWFTLASMVSWVLALIVGAFMIWMPESAGQYAVGFERFFRFLVIVLILQGALLHIRLYSKAFARYQTTFTSVVAYVTMGLLVILAVMLILPLLLEEFVDFRDVYWKVVVALAILVAVGTALVPLVNALFAPRKPRPAPVYGAPQHQVAGPQAGYAPQAAQGGYGSPTGYAPQAPQAPQGGYAPQAPQGWPTYADGRTPLPVLPDGSPDWNAYYTGWPTYPQPQQPAAQPQQPAAPGQPSAPPAPTQPQAPSVPPAPEQPGYPPAPPAPPQP